MFSVFTMSYKLDGTGQWTLQKEHFTHNMQSVYFLQKEIVDFVFVQVRCHLEAE